MIEIYIIIALSVVLIAALLYYFLVIQKHSTVKSITAEEFKELMKSDVLIIDIRVRKEFKKGFIPGAINIPYSQVEKKVHTLHNTKPVLLYCPIGVYTKKLRHVFLEAGFKEIYDLKGGLKKWPYTLTKKI